MYFQECSQVVIGCACSAFVKSNVVDLINENIPLPRIIKGLHECVASRIDALARRLDLKRDIVITGGVAKNTVIIDALENVMGYEFTALPQNIDPQIVGALGAALIGYDKN